MLLTRCMHLTARLSKALAAAAGTILAWNNSAMYAGILLGSALGGALRDAVRDALAGALGAA